MSAENWKGARRMAAAPFPRLEPLSLTCLGTTRWPDCRFGPWLARARLAHRAMRWSLVTCTWDDLFLWASQNSASSRSFAR